jgi:uncharacterized protein (DUF2267 family)
MYDPHPKVAVDYEGFLSIVEQQTDMGKPGLDGDEARAATSVVLETLAERLHPRIVDDLIKRLPPELHAPLERGTAHHDGRPRTLPVEKFLDRVAERAGVTRDRAADYTEAVSDALREAVDASVFEGLYG